MKKGLAILIAVIVMLGSMTAFSEEMPICLALGDSISSGYGLGENEKGFTEIFAEQNGFRLVNKAVDGYTAVNVLVELGEKETLMSIKNAEVITITCGGNDLLGVLFLKVANMFNARPEHRDAKIEYYEIYSIMIDENDPRRMELLECIQIIFDGDPEAGVVPFVESADVRAVLKLYTVSLNSIISAAKMMNRDVTVIVATQYSPFKGFSGDLVGLDTHVGIGVSLLSDTIRENAEKGGYLVAEVHGAFEAAQEDLLNASMTPLYLDIHPNAAGHKVIAQCFQDALDKKN